ncbi:MAG: AAA family ATPase, partial [Alphaproteobacteria bacterium]|nr:AAA family ATPase [Alphaproteobacteria bacterium]
MAIYHMSAKILSRSSRNTVGATAYRAGCKLIDQQTGKSFDFRSKSVQHVELLLPESAPQWAHDLQNLITGGRQGGVQKLIDLVEGAEKRKDAQVYRELEFALPQEFTDEQNFALAREFLQDQCCKLGITVLANFHLDTDEETGEYKPHCHALLLTRRLEEHGLSAHKERAWNTKTQLLQWREQWAAYTNFHLKMNGFETTIDHRSNYNRGIELEGQPKQGKGVTEMERRLQQQKQDSFKDQSPEGAGDAKDSLKFVPILDKIRAFQEVKLKNLYRIIRRPEVVLEIATKNQATFMWGDVQKILARYVDDAALYQKLEAKLQNSRELVLLRTVQINGAQEKEAAVYTTRAMLKAELNVVRLGEQLGKVQSHLVKLEQVNKVMTAYDQELLEYGGLSADQKAAILHLTKGDQLSCVIGYAGAGKTTALKAAKEIWEAEGFRVYGLASTGKASQNLEQLGIQSKTLHKFLHEFESGRCRYSSKSVLMLDEAGMVDTERFESFLKAVNTLGVKAVIVGDSAQLQPVEAGAALRLVTERIVVAKLETIVRQKEDWQREATKLFGQLKTREAIEAYYQKGCIEFGEEKVPDLKLLKKDQDHRGVVELYNLSRRVAGNIYHSMLDDFKELGFTRRPFFQELAGHQDYNLYQEWKERRQACAKHMHDNITFCKPFMKELGVDPQEFVLWFVDRSLPKQQQLQEAKAWEIRWNLPQLDEHQDRHVCDVKALTKQKIIEAFLTSLKAHPEKSHLMFAYTNRDTRSMNEAVRSLLKQEGNIGKEDYLYTIHRQNENDFEDKIIFKEERHFAVGDRLLFTRNDNGLGVSNGTLGTVTSLNRQTIQVHLDGTKESDNKIVSFVPKLYPYFDQGWAATIHKTQGADADKCFLLASREMYRNLSYVGMTRHKESLKVFGSKLDFWRDEIFMNNLSSMNEKLMGIDYVSSDQAYTLMKDDDCLLSKVLNRIGNQLDAIKYVSRRSWQEVCIQFLGKMRETDIVFPTEHSLSEAERAKLLGTEKAQKKGINSRLNQSIPGELAELAASNTAHKKGNRYKEDAVTQLGAERLSGNTTVTTGKQEKLSLSEVGQDKPASLEARVIQTQAGSNLRSIFKTHLIQTQKYELNDKDLRLIDKVARNVTEQVENFRAHMQKQPQKEDLRIFMQRALYEEKRIPRIEKDYLKNWKETFDHISAAERPKIRIYAERIALIEGRLYEQAMRGGKKPPQSHKLNQQACQELAMNQKLQAKEAKTWQTQLNLSDYAASRMANEVLRHQERYGVKPMDVLFEAIKTGIQYQEQRMPSIKSELREDLAESSNRKLNKQDLARISAVAEYVT